MICDCCRKDFATVHLATLSTLCGETPRSVAHLCRNCHGYYGLGMRVWICPACWVTVGDSARLILRDKTTGELAYFHPRCLGQLDSKWVTPEGLVKIERIVRQPRPKPPTQDALEVTLSPDPEEDMTPEEELGKPVGWTCELCDCELRDRKWDPTSWRCRFCGRYYRDPHEEPIHTQADLPRLRKHGHHYPFPQRFRGDLRGLWEAGGEHSLAEKNVD